MSDVELGCYGLENEGWFDPWALLSLFKNRAVEFGAEYVNGEAVGFEFRDQDDMQVKGVDGIYSGLDKIIVRKNFVQILG